MDLEELILRYYLSLFSIILILIYIFVITNIISIYDKNTIIKISKGQSVSSITSQIFKENNILDKQIYFFLVIIINKFYSPINYGNFIIYKNSNFVNLINILTNKSNLNHKITIIEGWQKYQLNNYIDNYFNTKLDIAYENLLAETYIINSSNDINDFNKFVTVSSEDYLNQFKNNEKLNKYGIKNILIISSLVEKEAKNNLDKNLISSVIFNRLERKMKLQIDATVIFAITEGSKKFDRKLTFKDLKIQHPYNTYYIDDLPPGMICYVGPETIKSVLESTKSDFLFYFYNILEKKHIFSKNYNEHKKKLNEYRKKTK